MKLEIVLESFEDFKVAVEHNIDRVEVVSAFDLGGLTPSPVIVKEFCRFGNMNVQVMIRPRAGGFCYTGFEINVMIEEIKLLADLGVRGVVFGCLNENHFLDEKSLDKLVNTAKMLKLETTFNRAFDFCVNQDDAIKILTDLEFDRILSAGSRSSVENGYVKLESLLHKTKNKIGLIAGGGINQTNVLPLLNKDFESIHFAIRKKEINDFKTSILGEDYSSDVEKLSYMRMLIKKNTLNL